MCCVLYKSHHADAWPKVAIGQECAPTVWLADGWGSGPAEAHPLCVMSKKQAAAATKAPSLFPVTAFPPPRL